MAADDPNHSEHSRQPRQPQEQRRQLITTAVFIILVVIIIILLLRSCGTTPPAPGDPYGETQGSWSVGDKREENQDPGILPESITFSGRESYSVSATNKEIELFNPQTNTVNFVFSVLSAETGQVIAATGKVMPGQYAYINLYDHFPQAGSYEVLIQISTYSYAGRQLNGANAKAVVIVNK